MKQTIEITPAGIALVRIDRALTSAGHAGSVVDLDGVARRVEALVRDRDTWKQRALFVGERATYPPVEIVKDHDADRWHLPSSAGSPTMRCGKVISGAPIVDTIRPNAPDESERLWCWTCLGPATPSAS